MAEKHYTTTIGGLLSAAWDKVTENTEAQDSPNELGGKPLLAAKAYYHPNKYQLLKQFKTNIKLNPNWENLNFIEKRFPQYYFLNADDENFYIIKGAYDYLMETGKFLYE